MLQKDFFVAVGTERLEFGEDGLAVMGIFAWMVDAESRACVCGRREVISRSWRMGGVFLQSVPDPLGITAAIKHAKDDGLAADDSGIDGVGKAFREQAVKAKAHSVDSAIDGQRIDFRKHAVKK